MNGDLASITRANASAIRSRRAPSPASAKSGGSQAETSGASSALQKSRSPQNRRNASTKAGSNQRPLRRLAIARAAFNPPAAWKTSTVWARHRIRAGERDLLAAQAVGHSASVPVLVEAADRSRGVLGEEQHAGDLGAAVASGLHELAGDVRPRRGCPSAPRSGGVGRFRAPPFAATTLTPRAGSSSRRASMSPWPRGHRRRTGPTCGWRWPSSPRP